MRRTIIGFLSFGVVVAVLIGTLKLINWVPSTVQKGFIGEYKSVDDVKSNLKIKDIFVPSYFPQSFKWPPSVIWAQTKPFTAIVMEFKDVEKGDVGLIISQVAAGVRFIPDEKIKMAQIRENVNYTLKGRKVFLEVGTGKNEEPCSRISWIEGNYRITMVAKSRPFELLMIAESMLRQ
jgi:hypothetical protein